MRYEGPHMCAHHTLLISGPHLHQRGVRRQLASSSQGRSIHPEPAALLWGVGWNKAAGLFAHPLDAYHLHLHCRLFQQRSCRQLGGFVKVVGTKDAQRVQQGLAPQSTDLTRPSSTVQPSIRMLVRVQLQGISIIQECCTSTCKCCRIVIHAQEKGSEGLSV